MLGNFALMQTPLMGFSPSGVVQGDCRSMFAFWMGGACAQSPDALSRIHFVGFHGMGGGGLMHGA